MIEVGTRVRFQNLNAFREGTVEEATGNGYEVRDDESGMLVFRREDSLLPVPADKVCEYCQVGVLDSVGQCRYCGKHEDSDETKVIQERDIELPPITIQAPPGGFLRATGWSRGA